MSSTPESKEQAKNRFWKWFRLREGRTIYRTSFVLKHKDGTPCTITVEGAHAEYVAALANGIKARYAEAPRVQEPLEESLRRAQCPGL
jgi:hypothetical protein